MDWKPIKEAPRDGSTVMLGSVNHSYIEFNGRWGMHRRTGEYRWLDGHGNGLFEATHFAYHPQPPGKFFYGDPADVYDDGA